MRIPESVLLYYSTASTAKETSGAFLQESRLVCLHLATGSTEGIPAARNYYVQNGCAQGEWTEPTAIGASTDTSSMAWMLQPTAEKQGPRTNAATTMERPQPASH